MYFVSQSFRPSKSCNDRTKKERSIVKSPAGALLPFIALALAACAATPPLAPAVRDAAGSDSSSGDLLYVTNLYNSDVYVYSLPSLKPMERIGGLFEPQGACTDAHGTVWIAVTGDLDVREFKALDKDPIAVLADPLGFPASCAVNLKSGDLAVTDESGDSGPGQILIYKHARGTPTVYSNPVETSYFFAAYDESGNLYVDGLTAKSAYVISVLPAGKHTLSTMTIHGATLYYPGTVDWTGSSLILGDQECGARKTSCLYEASVSGSTATITKTIALSGSCDVAQVAIEGSHVYGGDYQHCTRSDESTVDRWAFPAGGKPGATIKGVFQPVGAAVGAQ